jgi:uncharacterized protein Yka (UPF0111/DUF47 family)
MALVLLEEVLVGIEQASDYLERAVATLQDIVEDLHPDIWEQEKIGDILQKEYLKLLKERHDALCEWLEQLAETCK